MQTSGEHDTPEAAAARAQRQARIAINDLGTSSTRDGVAYMAHTDARGNVIHHNPFADAQLAARVQQRHAQMQTSPNPITQSWNTQSNFDAGNPQDPSDLFAGQSHRAGFAHVSAPVPAGPAAIPRTRGTQGNRSATAPSARAQRASSPASHGTVRFVGGQRVALPLPPRHQPGHGNNPSASIPRGRIPTGPTRRQPAHLVLQASNQPTPLNVSRTPPPAPRMAPRQPAPVVFPASAGPDSPNISRTPPPAPRLAPCKPAFPVSGCNSLDLSAAEVTDQEALAKMFDAIGTDQLIVLVAGNYKDSSTVLRAKIHVLVCAVKTSEPSNDVQKQGSRWVAIFHGVRKDLVSLAIDIEYMAEEDQPEQLKIAEEKYFEFGHLCEDVRHARAVAKESTTFSQDFWRGKKDVLDRVSEKEAALAAQEARRGLDTTIEQVFESFGPVGLSLLPFGVTTTVSGPATPVDPIVTVNPIAVHPIAVNPISVNPVPISPIIEKIISVDTDPYGFLRISDGDHQWGFKRSDGVLVNLPHSVTASILQLKLHSGSEGNGLLGSYVDALASVGDVLVNVTNAYEANEMKVVVESI